MLFVGVLKVVTFQVVVVSNEDNSFILINYGDIAETVQLWLVRPFAIRTKFSLSGELSSASWCCCYASTSRSYWCLKHI